MLFKLVINGYEPPPPLKENYSAKKNKIWTANTGRSLSGIMLGDIKTRKYTIISKWDTLTQDVVTNLDDALDTKAFFPVTFSNQRGEILTRNFYCVDVVYTLSCYRNGVAYYKDISIELIEQ